MALSQFNLEDPIPPSRVPYKVWVAILVIAVALLVWSVRVSHV